MRVLATLLIWAALPHALVGQFFPLNEATWCATSDATNRYRHLLDANPDTLVDGEVYQTVRNYWCAEDCSLWSTQNYTFLSSVLIRSAPDGKGYIRGLGDSMEYLVGDLSAAPGDTVQDVLILNGSWFTWENGLRPTFDVIVDSIVVVERWGVSVTRYFLHEVEFWNPDVTSSFEPRRFFWQVAMGTSHGLVLSMDASMGGFYLLECVTTGDSTVFSWYFSGSEYPPWGYPPGGPACCAPWDVGVAEHTTEPSVTTENPSSGLFRLNAITPINVAVFDAQGRLVTSVRGNEIDLTAQPPGVYTAVVRNAGGRAAIRLVVMR